MGLMEGLVRVEEVLSWPSQDELDTEYSGRQRGVNGTICQELRSHPTEQGKDPRSRTYQRHGPEDDRNILLEEAGAEMGLFCTTW